MNVGWQDAVTLALVAAAAIYLIRRVPRLGRGRPPTDCGTCANCPEPSEQTRLVSIDPPKNIDPPKKDPYGDNTTA